jgi:Tfp pilus assembly protein PilO
MAIDMNADIGEIFKGLFSKNTATTKAHAKVYPYKNIVIGGVSVVGVVLLYLIFIFLPKQDELATKSGQVSQISQLKSEIVSLGQEVLLAKDLLVKRKSRFEQMSKRFLAQGELDKLYRYISRLALTHKIMIAKLEQISDKPVFQLVSVAGPNGVVAYYRLTIRLDASGNFLSWSKFRRDLAKMDKIIVIESEHTKLVKSKKEIGRVAVNLVLAAYRWPANDDEKYVTE